MATREQNERRFPSWEEMAEGGRRYWIDIPGRQGGFARYVKVVDINEATVLFIQEIYDDRHVLVAIHPKFPVDEGHRMVQDDT